jgi:hypothetical protein
MVRQTEVRSAVSPASKLRFDQLPLNPISSTTAYVATAEHAPLCTPPRALSSRTPRSKRSYTPSVRLFNSGITANILAEGGSLVADIIRRRVPVTVVAVFVVAALLDSRHLGGVFTALGLAQWRSEGQAGEEGGENNGGFHDVVGGWVMIVIRLMMLGEISLDQVQYGVPSLIEYHPQQRRGLSVQPHTPRVRRITPSLHLFFSDGA